MPNWVNNSLTVTGSKDDLDKFVEQVGRTYTRQYTRMVKTDDGFRMVTEEDKWEGDFCFWNIHAPDESILDEYHGEARFGEMSENNWYAWNNNNWGTKWDADTNHAERDGDNEWRVHFSTAWSPPYPVLETAAKQHPNLRFWLEWEEEQGFGAEVEFTAAEGAVEVRTWGIPESHADFVDRDNEEGCVCSYDDDQQYWFDDCPGKSAPVDPELMEDLLEMAEA